MEKEDLEKISEEEKGNFWKKFFGILFFLFVLVILIVYWFLPFRSIEFNSSNSGNSNFSLNNSELVEMQFYKNMRYPSSNISYQIEDCTLSKRNNIDRAFEILENETLLRFYPVENNEEITITCSDELKQGEDLNFFIAGEGGPTKIIRLDEFILISGGKVLLLRESKCPNPNVGIHELLHALGFNHSSNPDNIMYPITKCSQTLGEEIPTLINELYSYPSYPDLRLENASAVVHSRYLDLNVTVKNYGFVESEEANMIIYVNNESIEDYELGKIGAGKGKSIFLKNFRVPSINIDKIELFIDSNFSELNKENNLIELKIKK